jgi:methylthioribulose-1-phosphate dehydratase
MSPKLFSFQAVAEALAKVGHSFYERGWVLGTGGNFSAVVSRVPLRLLITASGLHKGELAEDSFLLVDETGQIVEGDGKPSAETLIHLAIARSRDAGVVLHTHSVESTILSDVHFAAGGLAIEGYEMLKGLAGVITHEHREGIPLLENTLDYPRLAEDVAVLLRTHPAVHGFLLRRHGLYTWGQDVLEAKRHVEILEFLFQVLARQQAVAER